jgi:hypothetical protein
LKREFVLAGCLILACGKRRQTKTGFFGLRASHLTFSCRRIKGDIIIPLTEIGYHAVSLAILLTFGMAQDLSNHRKHQYNLSEAQQVVALMISGRTNGHALIQGLLP